MKICFISAALPNVSCGIGDYTDALARALARRDQEVVVLTTASPDLRPPYGYRAVPLRTSWSLRDAGRITAAVRREDPDVAHLQFPGVGYGRGFGASFAPWAIRLRGQGPLLVTTLHEFHTFRLRHRARLAVAASACDLVIAPDRAVLASVRRYLRWRGGLETAFIPVAASLWPAARTEATAAPDAEGELVIGYWGFLRPDKGVDLLLEALVEVRRARPARLVLAGDPGPDQAYAAGLLRKVADLGLTSAIQSTGKLPAEQLSAVLQSFDACVLPFRDGLSHNRTTYAGAVAHGLYVVTTGLDRRGFVPETNTTFVPPNDRDALVSAILDAPSHPRNQGTAAPEAAWDEIADLHLAAYRKAGARAGRLPRRPVESAGAAGNAVAPDSVDIAGIPIHNVTFDEAVKLIAGWVTDGSGGAVCTPNVDHIVKAHRMPDFRAAILGMRLRLPDGMGIVYGSRIAGTPLKGSVTGRLLPEALAETLGSATGLAFFGGRPGVAEEAARVLQSRGTRVVAALAPGMGFVVGSDEDAELTRRLRDSGAGVIFVCLGAPRQELWMARHAGELPAVLVGVGAAVDVLAGRSPTAPPWMTRLGVEWAFRLVHEPRRLARRYLRDDPRFFWWMLRQRARSGLRRR